MVTHSVHMLTHSVHMVTQSVHMLTHSVHILTFCTHVDILTHGDTSVSVQVPTHVRETTEDARSCASTEETTGSPASAPTASWPLMGGRVKVTWSSCWLILPSGGYLLLFS